MTTIARPQADASPRSKPASVRAPLQALVPPLLTLLVGVFVAKFHSGHTHHIYDPLLNLRSQCILNEICPWYKTRPLLPSGNPSSRLWDVPRRHLLANYSILDNFGPQARIVSEWTEPRVVVFDGLFDDQIDVLLSRTEGNFEPTTVVDEHDKEVPDDGRTSDTAFLSPHEADHKLNDLTDSLVHLVGFPGRQYVETIEVNRYNASGFFNIHYDFLSDSALKDGGSFHGCQRVATALLILTDFSGGETVFVRNATFRGGFTAVDATNPDHMVVPSVKGRLLVWFNVHPMTEQIDRRTWHGGMPVADGVKIAATFYVRNCSRIENEWRRAATKRLLEARPSPSANVTMGEPPVPGDEDDEDDDLDEEEEKELMQSLRLYKKIKEESDGKNLTNELIKAGFDPDDFEELDDEIMDLDEDDDDEEELELLRKYKRIKEESNGKDATGALIEAGFDPDEFEELDEAIREMGDELDMRSGEEDAESDTEKDEVEDEYFELDRDLDTGENGARGEEPRDKGEISEKVEDSPSVFGKELRMDPDSIQSFERELGREQGFDDDNFGNDDYDEEGDGQCGGAGDDDDNDPFDIDGDEYGDEDDDGFDEEEYDYEAGDGWQQFAADNADFEDDRTLPEWDPEEDGDGFLDEDDEWDAFEVDDTSNEGDGPKVIPPESLKPPRENDQVEGISV